MTFSRKGLGIGALAVIFSLASAACLARPFEEADTSRWGGDYRRFEVAGGSRSCAAVCASDSQCKAWSFIKPGVIGPAGECRLKSGVPNGNLDPCCVSGVAGGASNTVAEAKPSKTSPTPAQGVTAATFKPSPGTAETHEEALQMPIEAEPPEALTAITAPVDLKPSQPQPASH